MKESRQQAVELAKRSGIPAHLVREIEEGCSWVRVARIADSHIRDIQPGTVTGLDGSALLDLYGLAHQELV